MQMPRDCSRTVEGNLCFLQKILYKLQVHKQVVNGTGEYEFPHLRCRS